MQWVEIKKMCKQKKKTLKDIKKLNQLISKLISFWFVREQV